MTIGEALRTLREDRGLKQIEVAELLAEAGHPHTSKQQISNMEHGRRTVNASAIDAYVVVFGVSDPASPNYTPALQARLLRLAAEHQRTNESEAAA